MPCCVCGRFIITNLKRRNDRARLGEDALCAMLPTPRTQTTDEPQLARARRPRSCNRVASWQASARGVQAMKKHVIEMCHVGPNQVAKKKLWTALGREVTPPSPLLVELSRSASPQLPTRAE